MSIELERYDSEKHPRPKLAPAQSELEYIAATAINGPLMVTIKSDGSVRARLYIELL